MVIFQWISKRADASISRSLHACCNRLRYWGHSWTKGRASWSLSQCALTTERVRHRVGHRAAACERRTKRDKHGSWKFKTEALLFGWLLMQFRRVECVAMTGIRKLIFGIYDLWAVISWPRGAEGDDLRFRVNSYRNPWKGVLLAQLKRTRHRRARHTYDKHQS